MQVLFALLIMLHSRELYVSETFWGIVAATPKTKIQAGCSWPVFRISYRQIWKKKDDGCLRLQLDEHLFIVDECFFPETTSHKVVLKWLRLDASFLLT